MIEMCCIKKKNDKNCFTKFFLIFLPLYFLRQKIPRFFEGSRREMKLYFKYHWNSFRLPDFEINGRETFEVFLLLLLETFKPFDGIFYHDIRRENKHDYSRGCFSFSLCVSSLTFQVSSLAEIARNNAVAHGSREILSVPFNSFVTKGRYNLPIKTDDRNHSQTLHPIPGYCYIK